MRSGGGVLSGPIEVFDQSRRTPLRYVRGPSMDWVGKPHDKVVRILGGSEHPDA